MKKLHISSVSILVAALCLAFTACNQGMTAGNETGTVQIVIGGGAARSVDGEGLPVFNEHNTKITVTKEDGSKLVDGEQKTSLTLQVAVGKKITVEVKVTTAAGEWCGSEEHTVTAGNNDVTVKLSKAPKDVANLLLSITGKHPSGSNIVSLSMKNGKKLLDGILINNSAKPLTARDSIGRLYLFYQDRFSVRHFKRFDVEGKEDTSFPGAALLTAVLDCTDIAVDIKTDTLFLVARTPSGWKIYYTNKENSFVPLLPANIAGIDSTVSDIHAVAAYNGIVYLAVTKTGPEPLHVMACKADLSGPSLVLTKMDTKPLQKLRTAPSFGNNSTKCIGLFADEDGVYCLLKEQELRNGKMYAQGQLVHYTYSGSTLTEKIKAGLNPVASTENAIAFNARYFSNPIGFIGYDKENIYIADDGLDIQYVNENWRIKGNKNRIAVFNRKTGNLSFRSTNATWIEERSVYKFPDTKILLWKKGDGYTYYGMQYWVADTANTSHPVSSADEIWFSDQWAVIPTDIFCYDQDGNLYILWKYGPDYKVRRFALKEDGSYEKQGEDISLTSHEVSAIAVDISDGQNSLYYTYAYGSYGYIQKKSWNVGSAFSTASDVYGYEVPFNANDVAVTALAANKDGLFVAIKEQIGIGGGDDTKSYTLKVTKYKKDSPPTQDGVTPIVSGVAALSPYPKPSATDYTHYKEAVRNLQIIEGVLYGITSKTTELQKYIVSHHEGEAFKNSSVLYKIGKTADPLPASPAKSVVKNAVDTAGEKTGYGFYRFIAVKPKKLVIASDGACDTGGSTALDGSLRNNTDKVLEYDLQAELQSEKTSGGGFSKTLTVIGGTGFDWE
ncbi:hypothetical protein C5N99_07470 [Treponema medium]|uniref:hypothetical protein n=1 Tax=Treponema medium TaxID=58231 RepID=UPI00197CE04A|nr:hypothetical protein [Treponema medium]QSH92301.1 hypothetical protein C5N99_06750 [Treponema medium]QSH92438.1 hypothetical protein C5N99_07470 [Treponema medium]